MKSNKIFCLFLCLSILLSITACSNAEDPLSSNSSIPSNSTATSTDSTSSDEDYSDVEIVGSEDSNTNSSSSNQQTSSNTSSNTNSSSESELSSDDLMEMLYGFKSIKRVDYNCVRNLEGSDTIYSVSAIITNKDTDIVSDTSVSITCADKNVKIDGAVITIPSSYTKNKKSVKFTVAHSGVGTKYDFTINPVDSWNLIFEDTFDGPTVNTDVWNVWDEKRDWRYSYSKDNMFIDDNGNLVNTDVLRQELEKQGIEITGETAFICNDGAVLFSPNERGAVDIILVRNPVKIDYTLGITDQDVELWATTDEILKEMEGTEDE